ncbi:class III lanthionine synthetase LanKC N-terminal domain-containing protein [Saccharopolyspora sp. NPDC002376]
MNSTTSDLPDRLARAAASAGREVAVDDPWVSMRGPGRAVPDQGWKLHISARPGTLGRTVDIALPLLLTHDCDFKVARSPEVLRELNSGDVDPATAGKAMTVYPPQDDVVRLGGLLAEALVWMTGPRITSDRRPWSTGTSGVLSFLRCLHHRDALHADDQALVLRFDDPGHREPGWSGADPRRSPRRCGLPAGSARYPRSVRRARRCP